MTPADVDLVIAAASLFDEPPTADSASQFLASAGHHLCIAHVDGVPAGFVSGIEMCHPDKGIEMFLYELGVDDAFRGRGIGRALVTALAARAEERGCYGMWVLTDAENDAALAAYTAAGAGEPEPQVMLEWRFGPDTV
jgi:ribosomal protein S18 acetylase RimI-like enzyme